MSAAQGIDPPLDLLKLRELPYLCRRNYLCEFRHILPWSVLAGLLEGSFGGVVVSRTFGGSDALIAIAVATPMASYLFSLYWGMLCLGRPKIRLITLFALGTALLAGTVAVIPRSPAGVYWYIAQMAAAQVMLAGVVTIRPAVWKANYPFHIRGRITARIQGARVVVSTCATLLAARAFDRDAGAYAYVYPIAAACGLAAVLLLRRIRVRGEGRELRRWRPAPDHGGAGDPLMEPYSLTALLSPGRALAQMVTVLRQDRRYALYMLGQFCLGVSNILPRGVVVVLLTRELPMWSGRIFWVTVVLTEVLPKLMLLGSLRTWGKHFDTLGVVRFRVVNSVFWATATALGLAGTLCLAQGSAGEPLFLPLSVMVFAAYALVHGIGQGGGTLAWHIGHLHFAAPERAEVYMGIHVTLTGIRGLAAPLVGVWLWNTAGWGVWVVSLALALVALAIFASMGRHEDLASASTLSAAAP